MLVFVFLCVLPPATSFLIDVSTPIPLKAGTSINDLFIEERNSRQNLEKYVIHLNQRMTEMAKDVISTKTKVGVLEKTHYNADLQEAFRALQNSSEIMKQGYAALLLEHNNLKREVNVVTQKNNQLQIEVDSLKELQTIVPLQRLANLDNFTVHLEKEIQSTNSVVKKVMFDANARKQDFIALMNATNVLKTRLSDTQLFFHKKFKNIEIKQNLTETSDHEFESKMDEINQTLTANTNGIENRMNANIRQLTKTSQNISNVLKTKLSETKLFVEKKLNAIEIKYNLTVTANVNELENRMNANIQNLTAISQIKMTKLTKNNGRGKYLI